MRGRSIGFQISPASRSFATDCPTGNMDMKMGILEKANLPQIIAAAFLENKMGRWLAPAPSRKCARVVGELISWALRPTRLAATIQVLI
jgi:hypothetical protein